MKEPLNLSIDAELIQRAKTEAERRGTSVSQMVEGFFASLESSESDSAVPDEYRPSDRIRSLRASLRSPEDSPPNDPSWDEDRLVEELKRKHQ
jgi:hypothetical protein